MSEPTEAVPALAPSAEKSSRLTRIEWLEAHDRTSPEKWLASREAGRDVAEDDPSVASLRRSLLAAQRHFGDPSRMIANRAVQLEGMLLSVGVEEPSSGLIDTITEIGKHGRPVDGFGALCQHYFNLRRQGLSREAALGTLKARDR